MPGLLAGDRPLALSAVHAHAHPGGRRHAGTLFSQGTNTHTVYNRLKVFRLTLMILLVTHFAAYHMCTVCTCPLEYVIWAQLHFQRDK